MSANAILRVLTLSLMLLNSPTTSALPTLVSQVADPFFEDTFWTARARALGDLVSPLDPHPIFIVNTIEGKAYDGDIEYKWGPLSGVIPTDVDFSPTNAYSSFLPVVETVETLLVTNISLDTPKSNFGSAGMYTPIARGSRAYFDFLFGGDDCRRYHRADIGFLGKPNQDQFFQSSDKSLQF